MIDLPKPIKLAWGIRREGRSLWSRNAVKGVSVRGERRKRDGRNEWRLWDPNRSKVAASVLKTKGNAALLLPESGSTCLYLGASSGGTVSHIHDNVCGAGNHHGGQVVAVDISPRMMRDLVKLAERRQGLVPVLADARNPLAVAPYIREKADWLHQDLSIGDQAETFVRMTSAFLKEGGSALLSLKSASEKWMEGGDDARFEHTKSVIENCQHLELIEVIDISVFEEQHAVFYCKKSEEKFRRDS